VQVTKEMDLGSMAAEPHYAADRMTLGHDHLHSISDTGLKAYALSMRSVTLCLGQVALAKIQTAAAR
jgi:sialic acid synthase SpsE